MKSKHKTTPIFADKIKAQRLMYGFFFHRSLYFGVVLQLFKRRVSLNGTNFDVSILSALDLKMFFFRCINLLKLQFLV